MDVVDLADNKEIFTTGGLLEKHLLFCFRHGEAVPIYQLHSRCLGFPFDGFMRLKPWMGCWGLLTLTTAAS